MDELQLIAELAAKQGYSLFTALTSANNRMKQNQSRSLTQKERDELTKLFNKHAFDPGSYALSVKRTCHFCNKKQLSLSTKPRYVCTDCRYKNINDLKNVIPFPLERRLNNDTQRQ